MKKYLSILAMFAVMFAASSLVISCGGDDFEDDANNKNVDNGNNKKNTSGLVGRWKVVSDITITDFGKKLIDEPGAIWVFTDKTLTIYDKSDIYNEKAVEYTFRDNEIICSGFPNRKVESLTETRMVLTCKTFAGYDQTVTLEREE